MSITDAAKILGVTRSHLSLVVHGHRQSKALASRFRALLELKQATTAK